MPPTLDEALVELNAAVQRLTDAALTDEKTLLGNARALERASELYVRGGERRFQRGVP